MSSGFRTFRISGWLAVERLICSSFNYWFMFVVDIFVAIGFLVVGVRLSSLPLVGAMASVVVGFLAWGGVEYGIHRWVLHGPSSRASRAHAMHHDNGKALIAAPAFMSAALAGATWAALSVPLTVGQAALAVFGLYAGYNYYALLHHLQHRYGRPLASVPYFGRLEQAHRIHHAKCVVNYGVSTTWWDRAFGSYQPPARPAVRCGFLALGRTRSAVTPTIGRSPTVGSGAHGSTSH